MKCFSSFLFFLIGLACLRAGAELSENRQWVQIFPGQNQVLKVPGLLRIAVGDGKIVKARAIPPDEVLVTAKTVGETLVRCWSESGPERVFQIRVRERSAAIDTSGQRVVRVALQFLEFRSSDLDALGIQWPDSLHFQASSNFYGGSGASGGALNYSASLGSFQAFVHMLERSGWATVRAQPEVFVRLGETAHFQSGGEVPILTSRGSFGQAFQHVSWKPYGIQISVSPDSSDGLVFRSQMDIELTDLDASTRMGDVPGFSRTKLSTKVDSLDGETILLSGLVRQQKSHLSEGLPFFSRIPVLGIFFSKKSDEGKKTEAMLAVTLAFRRDASDWSRWNSLKERVP